MGYTSYVAARLRQLRLRRILPVLACAAFALAAAETAAAATVTTPTPEPGATITLSNEKTWTLSARVMFNGRIHTEPSNSAPTITRLHQLTEDGYQEVYLALKAYTDAQGTEWTQIRIPGRPNGRIGWVERDFLGGFSGTRWSLVVNRKTLRLTAFWNGQRRFRRPVGIGKRRTPTPAVHFWIREKIKVGDRKSPYWPYALGTADYSTLSEWPGGGVVGIHGDWNQPALIPGRPSHGCIRMHDGDVGWIARNVPVGAPLRIL